MSASNVFQPTYHCKNTWGCTTRRSHLNVHTKAVNRHLLRWATSNDMSEGIQVRNHSNATSAPRSSSAEATSSSTFSSTRKVIRFKNCSAYLVTAKGSTSICPHWNTTRWSTTKTCLTRSSWILMQSKRRMVSMRLRVSSKSQLNILISNPARNKNLQRRRASNRMLRKRNRKKKLKWSSFFKRALS